MKYGEFLKAWLNVALIRFAGKFLMGWKKNSPNLTVVNDKGRLSTGMQKWSPNTR